MKGVGWLLLVLGIAIGLAALVMDTSVATRVPASLGLELGLNSGLSLPTETYNLGLLQRQMLIFVGGCTLFVTGAVFMAAGALQDKIAGSRGSSVPDLGQASADYDAENGLTVPATLQSDHFTGMMLFIAFVVLLGGIAAIIHSRGS